MSHMPYRPGQAMFPPPEFYGHPSEDLRQFLYKLGAISSKCPQLSRNHHQVSIASQCLGGPALDWFLDLLRKNARQVAPTVTLEMMYALGRATKPDPLVNEKDPYSWLQLEFVIEELRTWDGFLDALWAKFGHCQGDCDHSTRPSSPTSTIGLFSSANSDITV